jgi:hypothetical protein
VEEALESPRGSILASPLSPGIALCRAYRPPPPPPPIWEGGRQTWVRAVGDEQSLLNPDPGMGLVFTY